MAEIKQYFGRTAEKIVEHYLSQNYIVAVLGARQTGKTTLVKNFAKKSKLKTFYFLFDDILLQNQVKSDFYFLQKQIESQLGTTFERLESEILVVIDEAQKAPDVFDLVKIWHDTIGEKIKVILSGSASLEIQKKTAESMAGRAQYVYLQPLSIGEILSSKLNLTLPSLFPGKLDNLNEDFLREKNALLFKYKREIQLIRDELLVYGALPGIWQKDDKNSKFELLKSAVTTYLEKDIRQAGLVHELSNFQKTLQIFSLNAGGILNYENYSRQTQINVKTVKNYRQILENTFVLQTLTPDIDPYSQIVKSPKCYLFDTGITNFLAGRETLLNVLDSRSSGGIFETIILNSFLAFAKNEIFEPHVHYFRNYAGREIDLIIRWGENERIPVEMTMSERVEKEKINNLRFYAKTQKGIKAGVVVYNGDLQFIKADGLPVYLIPWWLWG